MDYDAIVARFGAPKQVVASYLTEMGSAEIKKELTIKKRILAAVSISMITVVLLWAGVVAATYAEAKKSINGYYVERIGGVVYSTEEGE